MAVNRKVFDHDEAEELLAALSTHGFRIGHTRRSSVVIDASA